MPTVEIPLASDVMTNVDQTSVRDGSYRLFNAITDESGSTVGLPGFSSFHSLSSFVSNNDNGAMKPVITGLYWASKQSTLVVAVGGTLTAFQLRTDPQTTPVGNARSQRDFTGDEIITPHVSITDVSTYPYTYSRWGTLGSSPAQFMYDGSTYLFGVGGEVPCIAQFTTGGFVVLGPNNKDVSTIPNMPTSCGSIAYLDSYCLVNNIGSNRFNFSNVGDVYTWSASDLASAAGYEDNLTRLVVLNRRIYLFGRQSIEIWENDGVTPFSRVSGGFIEGGTVAPFSVVVANQSVYWFDATRRFATFSGSDVAYLESPFDKELANLPYVADAQGYTCIINGNPLVIWDFPSAQKTYALKLRGEQVVWSQLGFWNGDTYMGSSVTGWLSVPEVGLTLCYDKGGSTIYALSQTSRTDGVKGGALRVARVTGHLDFGTQRRKLSNEIRLRIKRGRGSSTSTPKATLRWRDNGEGPWTGSREIDLGRQGERELTVRLPRMGVFRTRQFEFSVTDDVPVNVVSAEMDLDVLGS